MDVVERCDACGYDYGSVGPENASERIRAEALRVRGLLDAADAGPARHRPDASWSALQYAGHLRDMLLVQRERVLAARLSSAYTTTPMGRDDRVAWGEYDVDPREIGADVARAAEWLAHTMEILADADWSRTLVYNYPEPAERSLAWLAAHTVHELVHHRDDINQLLGS